MTGRLAQGTRTEMGTERTHGTGLAMESWFPENLRAKRDFGVDASTPRPGINDWPRMRHLGQYSPIPEMQSSRLPTGSAQPDFCGAISSPACR